MLAALSLLVATLGSSRAAPVAYQGPTSGVGLILDNDNDDSLLIVAAVVVHSWADYAGVQPGDNIVAIDGTPTKGQALDAVYTELKKRAGGDDATSTTRLRILRGGDTLKLAVSRDPVQALGKAQYAILLRTKEKRAILSDICRSSVDGDKPLKGSNGNLMVTPSARLGQNFVSDWVVTVQVGNAPVPVRIPDGEPFPVPILTGAVSLELSFHPVLLADLTNSGTSRFATGPGNPLAVGTYPLSLCGFGQGARRDAKFSLTAADLASFRSLKKTTVAASRPDGAVVALSKYFTLDFDPKPVTYRLDPPRGSEVWIQSPGAPVATAYGEENFEVQLATGMALPYSMRLRDNQVVRGTITAKSGVVTNDVFSARFLGSAADILGHKEIPPPTVVEYGRPAQQLLQIDYADVKKDDQGALGWYFQTDNDRLIATAQGMPSLAPPEDRRAKIASLDLPVQFVVLKIGGLSTPTFSAAMTALNGKHSGDSVVVHIGRIGADGAVATESDVQVKLVGRRTLTSDDPPDKDDLAGLL